MNKTDIALSKYLRVLADIPLLTPEEEIELGPISHRTATSGSGLTNSAQHLPGALAELFGGGSQLSFACGDAEGKWLRIGSESHQFHSTAETVAKRVNGKTYSCAGLDR